jgi:hypothetical protein
MVLGLNYTGNGLVMLGSVRAGFYDRATAYWKNKLKGVYEAI